MKRFTFIPVLLLCTLIRGDRIRIRPIEPERVWQRWDQLKNSNAERQQALRQLFEQSGCPEISLQRVKGSKLENVVCRISGETDSEIIIGAHFDKVTAGTGAIDNWSGAALLPSIFEALTAERRKHTLVLVGFTDEEKGLVGSRAYVKVLSKEAKAKIRGMINVDCVGLGPLQVWVRRSDPTLVRLLGRVAGSLGIPVSGMNVDQVGDSDSHPFALANVPVLDLHSITSQNFPILHSDRDQPDKLNREEYLKSLRLVAMFVAFLDQQAN